jgi:Fibronectin type III domain
VNISPTTCTISGLVNGTSYVVEVVAINEVGSSTPATSDAIVTTTVPSAPTPVSLVPGNRTITVSWSAPSNNGGTEVTSYVATATDGNGTSFTCTTEAGLSSTCTISGLAVGSTYDVTIQARNVVGTSATARSGSTTTFTAPSAPVIVSSVGDPNRVVLTWSAPLQSGGLPVTSYTASDGQGHSCTTSTTSCTIRGLVNGRHYTFSVTATSAVGTSAARSFVSVAPLGANISTRVAGFAQFSSTVTPSMTDQIARTALSISLTGRKSVTIRGYGNLGASKSLQLARATSAREALTTALQVLGVNDISIVVRTGEATNTFGNGSPQANRCVVISTN